jgi:hypothetical protein
MLATLSKTYCGIASVLLLLQTMPVNADATIVRDINFGTIVILDNDSVQTVSISQLGALSYSSGIRPVALGETGLIEITGYSPGTSFVVSTSIIQANSSSTDISNEQFELFSIDAPTNITVAGTGIAEIPFGASIRTSGSGSESFTDTSFSTRVRFTIEF